jgi:hypothetical protein
MAADFVSALPKYRLHKGTGQGFVQVRGKRFYLGRWGTPKSKERYARFVAELPAASLETPPTTVAVGSRSAGRRHRPG